MSKLGKPISQRQLRVGEMIKQALSMIFLREETKITDIDTKTITVTEVRMSPDLKTAKVFVLPLGGKASFWDIDHLKTLNKNNTLFNHSYNINQIDDLYKKWKKAVHRSMNWI